MIVFPPLCAGRTETYAYSEDIMKRTISIVLLCVLAAGLLCGCGAENETEVSVQTVAMITGMGYIGLSDSYAGKVVSGETAEIKKASDKTVLEVLVQEGDMVKEGDVLFTYDMEAMQLSLDKLYIEKESLENTIASAESEISELQKQKKSASSSQQLSYTLQIDARQADKREAEYNLALKEKEISAMEDDMENTEITAPMAGRVMSVGSLDETGGDIYTGQETTDAFITIMDVSAYRVEGHINELNRGVLTEGMRVIARSRTDDDAVWRGVIESIDWEKPVQSNQSNYIVMDEMTSSSKYPFYVELDSTDGLLLGQHVYIEPDTGEEESGALMLPSYYILDADGDAWVWASSAKGRLEKRSIELGIYDPDTDSWEVLSGLTLSDQLAFPTDDLREGMTAVLFEEPVYEAGFEDYYGGEDDFYTYTEDAFYEDLPEDGYSEEPAFEEEGVIFEEYDDAVSDEIAG